MSMWKLAFKNFKESLKNYLSLMVSLAFTVLIFLNFQNVIDSGILDGLGKRIEKMQSSSFRQSRLY